MIDHIESAVFRRSALAGLGAGRLGFAIAVSTEPPSTRVAVADLAGRSLPDPARAEILPTERCGGRSASRMLDSIPASRAGATRLNVAHRGVDR